MGTWGEMHGQSLCIAIGTDYLVQTVSKITQRLDLTVRGTSGTPISAIKEAFRAALAAIYAVGLEYVQKLDVVRKETPGRRLRSLRARLLSDESSIVFDVNYEVTVPKDRDPSLMVQKGSQLSVENSLAQQQLAETLQENDITLEAVVETKPIHTFSDTLVTTADGIPLNTESFYVNSEFHNNNLQSRNDVGAIIGGVVGGIAGLAIAISLILYYWVKRNRKT